MTLALDAHRDVLIAVDVQRDFCPGGALAVADGDAVVPIINRLARTFTHQIQTQDWHPANHQSFASAHPGSSPFERIAMPYGEQVLWPDHCVQESPGAALHPDLHMPACGLLLRKGMRAEVDSYSIFFENDRRSATGLAGFLRERGLRRLFLAGLATDYCVAWSALDGRRLGFEVVLLLDACRAIDLDGSLAQAIKQMREAGVQLVEDSSTIRTA